MYVHTITVMSVVKFCLLVAGNEQSNLWLLVEFGWE